MLANGILLIFLSYFLFSQPGKLIATSGKIAGFIALLTGAISIISFLLVDQLDKSRVELITGLFSCLAGLFFLSGIAITIKLTTLFFALYMTLNTIEVVYTSWQLKTEINWWWFSLIFLLFSLLILYFFITEKTILGISIAVFAGFHFFVNGILLIILAFVTRKLQFEYGSTIKNISNGS